MAKELTAPRKVANDTNPLISLINKLIEQPDFNIDALRELRQMQKESLADAAENAFLADLAHLQGDLPSITREGKSNNNKYATYDDIMDVVRPIMAGYGFSFICIPNSHDSTNTLEVVGTLSHVLGHKLVSTIKLPIDTSGSKNATQSIGSTIKYGQRYCVCALLSISTHDHPQHGGDFDGTVMSYVDVDQANALEAAAAGYGLDVGKMFGYYSKKLRQNINDWALFPDHMYDEVMAQIETSGKKNANS